MWTLLEEACTELDLRLATERHGQPGSGGATFNQYSLLLEQLSTLKSQLESQTSHAELLEQLATYMSLNLPDPENSAPLIAIRREAAVARDRASVHLLFLIQSREISQLDKNVHKKFTPCDGPHFHSLEDSL